MPWGPGPSGPSVPAWPPGWAQSCTSLRGGLGSVAVRGGRGDMAVPGDGVVARGCPEGRAAVAQDRDAEALGHADGGEALVRGSDPDSMCIPPSPDPSPTRSARLRGFPWSRVGPRRGVRGSGEDQGPRRGWRQPGVTEKPEAASGPGLPCPPADLRDARRHSPPPFLPPPRGPGPRGRHTHSCLLLQRARARNLWQPLRPAPLGVTWGSRGSPGY